MRALVVFLGVSAMGIGAAAWLGCGSEGAPITIPPEDGGSGGSSGAPREAGAGGVTADGGIDPADAGPGGDTANVACGATTCPIPAEICCVSDVPNGGRGYVCVAGATCPTPAGGGDTTALQCTSAANCAAGTVCCVKQDKGVTASACQPSCGGGTGGGDTAQLCDRGAPDGGGCPASAPCSNENIGDWGLPRTFATCGGRGN